jgi:hypothetical protein
MNNIFEIGKGTQKRRPAHGHWTRGRHVTTQNGP